MENLIIKETKSTPEINFNSSSCLLEIKGVSYPENTSEFYGPIFNWLHTFLKNLKNQEVTINIDLVYFNSSSSKVLLDFFEILDEASEAGKHINVYWFYDDENGNAKEYGIEFQEDLAHLEFIISSKG
ncbi:MAG: DUF1987 domain-containing protein [Spirochaetales bacterium]|nr:DUF1987 domain-containing protein [Spirochaetales bacterium]